MSNIKPIKINPELFKVSGSQNKNKTLKNKPLYPVKSNVLKKDLLARIKNHRSHKQNNYPLTNLDKNNNYDYSNDNEDNYTNNESSDNRQNIDTINTLTQKLDNVPITLESNPPNKKSIPINNDQDDDFLQSINFLKTLSNKKNNTIKRKISQDFPIEKQENLDNKPEYGCLKNGSLPTFRQIHNSTIKRDSNDITNSTIPKIKSNNKKNVTFKYNLGKKHKVVSVLIKNVSTRKKISSEHTHLKEIKLNDMKNYLKRHNLLKSGSNAPPDLIKKLYEQSLLTGDVRNTNKNSIVHNYLAE
jgi:hypothetical protein